MANNQLPEYWQPDFKLPTAQYITPNENLLEIMKDQIGRSEDYRNKIGETGDALSHQYNQQAKSRLARSIKDVRGGFNRRGLLRSGMRMGAESGARASSASDMDAYRLNLNRQLLGNANQMDTNALNSGLLYAGAAPSLGSGALAGQQINLDNQISDQRAQQSLYGGLFSGIGSATGAALARRK
jgi:hypothetical protein